MHACQCEISGIEIIGARERFLSLHFSGQCKQLRSAMEKGSDPEKPSRAKLDVGTTTLFRGHSLSSTEKPSLLVARQAASRLADRERANLTEGMK